MPGGDGGVAAIHDCVRRVARNAGIVVSDGRGVTEEEWVAEGWIVRENRVGKKQRQLTARTPEEHGVLFRQFTYIARLAPEHILRVVLENDAHGNPAQAILEVHYVSPTPIERILNLRYIEGDTEQEDAINLMREAVAYVADCEELGVGLASPNQMPMEFETDGRPDVTCTGEKIVFKGACKAAGVDDTAPDMETTMRYLAAYCAAIVVYLTDYELESALRRGAPFDMRYFIENGGMPPNRLFPNGWRRAEEIVTHLSAASPPSVVKFYDIHFNGEMTAPPAARRLSLQRDAAYLRREKAISASSLIPESGTPMSRILREAGVSWVVYLHVRTKAQSHPRYPVMGTEYESASPLGYVPVINDPSPPHENSHAHGDELVLVRGHRYAFVVVDRGHPFYIAVSGGAGPGGASGFGKTIEGGGEAVVCEATMATGDKLLEARCALHAHMGFDVRIVDTPLVVRMPADVARDGKSISEMRAVFERRCEETDTFSAAIVLDGRVVVRHGSDKKLRVFSVSKSVAGLTMLYTLVHRDNKLPPYGLPAARLLAATDDLPEEDYTPRHRLALKLGDTTFNDLTTQTSGLNTGDYGLTDYLELISDPGMTAEDYLNDHVIGALDGEGAHDFKYDNVATMLATFVYEVFYQQRGYHGVVRDEANVLFFPHNQVDWLMDSTGKHTLSYTGIQLTTSELIEFAHLLYTTPAYRRLLEIAYSWSLASKTTRGDGPDGAKRAYRYAWFMWILAEGDDRIIGMVGFGGQYVWINLDTGAIFVRQYEFGLDDAARDIHDLWPSFGRECADLTR